MNEKAKIDGDRTIAPMLILGGGANIGLHLAQNLVGDGIPVIASYRSDPEGIVDLQCRFPSLVPETIPLDAKTSSSMDRFFNRLDSVTNSISGMINCIGPYQQKPLLETTNDEFDSLIEGNLQQAFYSIKRSIPLLESNGGGPIILFTFAGVENLTAFSKIAPYAASKTALLSLVRSFSVELASKSIRINSIAPGVMESEREEDLDLLRSIPQKRMTGHKDIYEAVKFLISKKAEHITGNNLSVSGGFGWKSP